jgi:hypothetical protein
VNQPYKVPASVSAVVRQLIKDQPDAIQDHVDIDIVMLSHTIGGMCRHPYLSSDWVVHNSLFGLVANGLALKMPGPLSFEASKPIIDAIKQAYEAEGMHLQSC